MEHEVERCKRRVVLLELESGGHDIACSQGEARGLPRWLGGSAGSRKYRRQNGGRGAEKPIDIPAATGKVDPPNTTSELRAKSSFIFDQRSENLIFKMLFLLKCASVIAEPCQDLNHVHV